MHYEKDLPDTACNALLLKIDVYECWDDQDFTFVPRLEEIDREKITRWVSSVLRRDCVPEVIECYHSVRSRKILGVDVEYLFYRFALTIFQSIEMILMAGSKRWLKVFVLESVGYKIANHNPDQYLDPVI